VEEDAVALALLPDVQVTEHEPDTRIVTVTGELDAMTAPVPR